MKPLHKNQRLTLEWSLGNAWVVGFPTYIYKCKNNKYMNRILTWVVGFPTRSRLGNPSHPRSHMSIMLQLGYPSNRINNNTCPDTVTECLQVANSVMQPHIYT